MKKLLLSIIVLASFLVCCNNEDPQPSSESSSIRGTWHLKHVGGGLQGLNLNYGRGQVKWTFDGAGNLVVENNIMTTGPEQIHSGFSTGTYPYEIRVSGDTTFLVLDNQQLERIVSISNNILSIDEGIVMDGFMRQLER
jgi:hypothetical protein